VGVQNLLSEGTCKKRFSKWIEDCEIEVDHKYVFENIGYNLKPLDLQGAIGLIQLDKLAEIEMLRKRNKAQLDGIFGQIKGVRTIQELPDADTSWFGVPIICNSRLQKQKLVAHLENSRVQTRNYFAGNILQQPAYRQLGDFRKYPNATEVLDKVFFVGCSPTISSEMIEYVDSVVKKFNF
jgi:CDP-4-dehydro-6-deoxyglucose reductase, E1